ncbi:RNA polymerase sigma-70 factor, ECF subfamily [Porphyromonadaceae bacterium NLAE-zl-C104]|nr:RNA polymerase sigma-70 factor, ECF subfamily [Porphyromonadaceae bacterium NLAE-zl-C104]
MEKHRDHISSVDIQTLSQPEFEELFCRFYPQVASYATVILDDRTAGEDIAQEVFVYVWEKRKELYVGNGFYSYLFQSAYSRCIDYIHKNKRLEKYAKESLLKFVAEYQSYIDNDSQTLKELFSKDFEERLNVLLGNLPEARRQVFELVYRDGLKAREVSEKLNIPQRTVESHIYLAMKYLREHLSPSDFFILALLCKYF